MWVDGGPPAQAVEGLLPATDLADRVWAAHEGALHALEAVTTDPFEPLTARVTLAQVRVARTAEEHVRKHLDRQLNCQAAGQAAALVGEPGVGKSCSLWGVYQDLSEDDKYLPFMLSATSLLAGSGRPADIRPHQLPDLLHELDTRDGRGRSMVLLLDTADLLIHQPENANALAELITTLRASNVGVVLACRRGEAGLLKKHTDSERGAGAYASLLANVPLDKYDSGRPADPAEGWAADSELDRAVKAYAAAYAAQHPKGSLADMKGALKAAAARGLPLGELIRHPLHLRMVFDLYYPYGPSGFDLDVAGLFNKFWEWRVVKDQRHATSAPGVELTEQTTDLGPVAAEIGLYTLREGNIELQRESVAELVAARLGVGRDTAAGRIGMLQRRGVLSASVHGRLRFHHQAIGEYAAGRGLSGAPAGLKTAVKRIIEHPRDLYLAEAARHAFHHTDHAHGDQATRWYAVLSPLAKASSPVAQETFLRILAGLRYAPAIAADDALTLVDDADNGRLLAPHYLARLKATGRPDKYIWPAVLGRIWAQAAALREESVRVLTVLLRQQPDTAAAFAHELPAQELAQCTTAKELIPFLRLLHEAGEPAPASTVPGHASNRTVQMVQGMLDHSFTRLGSPLEHTLAVLADLSAEWPETYGDLARGLPDRLAQISGKVPRAMDTYMALAAACWGAVHVHEETAETLHVLGACLSELAAGARPIAPHSVILRGIADTFSRAGARIAPSELRAALDLAAASAPNDSTRKAIARHLLCPLLMATETHVGGIVQEWCRAQMSHQQVRTTPQDAATALAMSALAHRHLPARVVAQSLPGDRRSEQSREWTTGRPWGPNLTVTAAAGGHCLATRALNQMTGSAPEEEGDQSPAKPRGNGRSRRKRLLPPREEVVARAAEAPGLLLEWLLKDAKKTNKPDALVAFVRAYEAEQLPAEHARELTLIAAHLHKQTHDSRAPLAAHTLTARMVIRGLSPLPAPTELARQLEALSSSPEAQRALIDAATQVITTDPGPRDASSASPSLSPVLDSLVERARDVAAADPAAREDKDGHVLAGYSAHLLQIRLAVLLARKQLVHRKREIDLDRLYHLLFQPRDLCVPSNHHLAKPSSLWPKRLALVPQLCLDLHQAGRARDAENLLEAVALEMTADSQASARWRQAAWNPWRPYLRLMVTERTHLYDLLIHYGPRDHQLGRHLLEVAGQALSNISEEVHGLLTDPRWPAALRTSARRTAGWAGRDGANLRWETIYDDITSTDTPHKCHPAPS